MRGIETIKDMNEAAARRTEMDKALRAIIAAWDEPHRGDLDAARDRMFEPIEAARRLVK